MNTAKQSLSKCDIFSRLSSSELEKIASTTVEVQYEAGSTLFEEGDAATELFILQEGKVALQMTLLKEQAQMSRRITVDVSSSNEIVGWSAIVEPYIYTLSAVCLQKISALSISSVALRQLLEDDPKIGFAFVSGLLKVVASRLHDTRQVLISERVL